MSDVGGQTNMMFRRWTRPGVLMVAAVACTTTLSLAWTGVAAATTVSMNAPTVGATLSATPDAAGDTVNWYECTSSGLGAQVAGPQTAAPYDYTVAETDVGYDLCAVDTTSSPATTGMSSAAASDPDETAPAIGGTAQQGDTLSVLANGGWTQSPSSLLYQWCRAVPGGCSPIPGANASSYTLGASDVGTNVEVLETPVYGTTAAYGATTVSGAGDDVLIAPPGAVSGPSITGTTALGDTLTASPGGWSESPTHYSFQWLTCDSSCTPIDGATGSTYRLSDIDVGASLAVAVTAANAGGSGPTQTSARSGVVAAPTSLGLLVPSGTVNVNQAVTLDAIVTSSVDTVDPSGSVTFEDGGTPIPGCVDQPVDASSQSVAVGCSTSFALGSPSITASYSQGSGSPLTGSSAGAQSITVAPDSSTVTLDAPGEVTRHTSVTYTASVVPADDLTGPVVPGGDVRFVQDGHTLSGCGEVALVDGGATCTASYREAGSEHVSAVYAGSASFHGSTSARRTVRVLTSLPRSDGRRPAGSIASTMQWTFHYTPRWTRILALAVHGLPAHAAVTVDCRGSGCPFTSRVHTITGGHPSLGLDSPFRSRRLAVDARVTILITRDRYVGEYYRFTMRSRRQPLVRIACLAPGSTRPGVGCQR